MDEHDSYLVLAGGWSVLTAWVVFWDWLCLRRGYPTMSAVYYRASRSRAGVFLILFWIYKFLHLTRLLPERFDIFRRGGTIVCGDRNGKEEAY